MRLIRSASFALIALALFVFSAPSKATATTITFDSLPYMVVGQPLVYQESGYEVTPTTSASFGSFVGNGVHMDVCCGPFSSGINLSNIAGSLFSLSSLDLLFYSGASFIPQDEHFISFTGYRNNSVVASLTGGSGLPGTLNFGAAFSAIDRLLINTNIPATLATGFGPDLHFDVDNIVVNTIAPVPLPAGLWSLLGGLSAIFMLASFTRIRSRSSG